MGRRRTFDEQRLLDCAQEMFWAHGYAATRVEDIGMASGIGNGSIYAAYGSKVGLFLVVFRRYCEGRVQLVDSVITAHSGSFEAAVANYLDAVIAECTSRADRRGCLMLNSLAELGMRNPEVVEISHRTVRSFETIVQARVLQAINDGELALSADESDTLAAHIVLVSQGLIQLSTAGAPITKLHRIAQTSSRMSALFAAAC